MTEKTLTKGIYRHYKGNLYQVLDVVTHSETEEKLVLYKALYGDFGLWVRPAAMFSETVTHAGENVRRFELIQPLEKPL